MLFGKGEAGKRDGQGRTTLGSCATVCGSTCALVCGMNVLAVQAAGARVVHVMEQAGNDGENRRIETGDEWERERSITATVVHRIRLALQRDPTAQEPSFTAPAGPATLTFSLVVNDGRVTSEGAEVTVTLLAPSDILEAVMSIGWNLIGNSTAVPLILPDGMVAFTYDDTGCLSATTLQPGQGAWLQSVTAQDIVLSIAE
jgi:hypothetical protein